MFWAIHILAVSGFLFLGFLAGASFRRQLSVDATRTILHRAIHQKGFCFEGSYYRVEER